MENPLMSFCSALGLRSEVVLWWGRAPVAAFIAQDAKTRHMASVLGSTHSYASQLGHWLHFPSEMVKAGTPPLDLLGCWNRLAVIIDMVSIFVLPCLRWLYSPAFRFDRKPSLSWLHRCIKVSCGFTLLVCWWLTVQLEACIANQSPWSLVFLFKVPCSAAPQVQASSQLG